MAVVASGVFMARLDDSIVNVSLPTLANELNASFDSVQWVSPFPSEIEDLLPKILNLGTEIIIAWRIHFIIIS